MENKNLHTKLIENGFKYTKNRYYVNDDFNMIVDLESFKNEKIAVVKIKNDDSNSECEYDNLIKASYSEDDYDEIFQTISYLELLSVQSQIDLQKNYLFD